jgi:hypothetical protein
MMRCILTGAPDFLTMRLSETWRAAMRTRLTRRRPPTRPTPGLRPTESRRTLPLPRLNTPSSTFITTNGEINQ